MPSQFNILGEHLQGVLNSIIDAVNGKAASGHTHDDRYYTETETNNLLNTKVNTSGSTLTGNVNWAQTDRGLTWAFNTDGAYIKFFNTGDGDTNSRLEFGTSDNGNEFFRWTIAGTEEATLKSDGLRVANSVYMAGNLVATQSWVGAQGYLTSVPAQYITQDTADQLYQPIGNYDNYGSWNLKTNGTQRTTVTSGGTLDIKAGTNVTVTYSAGGGVTIASTDTNTWRPLGTGATDAAAGNHTHDYLPLSGGTLTGDLKTTNIQITSATPTIYFNGTSDGGDGASSDMAIKATPEGLDFYEPEDGNKIHFRIYDDTGVDATYGYWVNGTQIITSGRALQNVTNTNWDAAYSWGNHASAGYGSAGDTAKGVEAFGWGDHAAAGYLTSLPGHTHSITDISDRTRLFNNMGSNHTTYTNFDSVSNFGPYFIQGTTNGPGTGSSQFYGLALGLGNDYAYGSYAMQMAIPRYEENDKYLTFRTREGGTWSGWVKFSAGYADSAGSASTASTATSAATWTTARTITIGSTGKSVNGSGNVSWSLAEIGAAAASHTHSYLPLGGGTLTGTLTGRDIVSSSDRTYNLGADDNRWRIVFCETLDSAGLHESNLASGGIAEMATGTVLVWKDGKNIPCAEFASHMRMGIAVRGNAAPLVQGAEPVLCTGLVNEGDYLVTSGIEGHATAVSRDFVLQHQLMDCVIGKALESADGESHLVKTWITI
jgi:hypothetical protein